MVFDLDDFGNTAKALKWKYKRSDWFHYQSDLFYSKISLEKIALSKQLGEIRCLYGVFREFPLSIYFIYPI